MTPRSVCNRCKENSQTQAEMTSQRKQHKTLCSKHTHICSDILPPTEGNVAPQCPYVCSHKVLGGDGTRACRKYLNLKRSQIELHLFSTEQQYWVHL